MKILWFFLLNISGALQKGQSLANASTWASRANSGAALIVVLNFIFEGLKTAGIDMHLDEQTLDALVKGISGLGLAVVATIHTASNPHAGITTKDKQI